MSSHSVGKGMEQLKKVSPFRLSSLLRLQKDPNLALKLFLNPNPNSEPVSKPFRHSHLSYDLIITKLGRAKMFDEMEKIMDQLKRETRFVPKEIIFCNVITFYGRARLPDQAVRAFDQIPSFRCRRTVKSLNTLLNALLLCKDFERIREFVMAIDESGCPDVCTYNILINACRICNDMSNARNMFDEMLRKGVQPNAVTFGTLINGLCLNSELDKAFKLKEHMQRVFKVRPNASVYVPLIKGLCRANDVGLAINLKDEMLRNKVELSSSVYSTLVTALFKAGRKNEVPEMLKEMKENGCKLETVIYNALIFGFCNAKEFDSAFCILEKMEEKGCKPDVVSYSVMIGGLCRDGRLREAHEVFEDMPRRKCAPDEVTYRTLFDGFCDGMKFKEAVLILDEMVFKGFAPRTESITRFVDGLVRNGDLELLWTVLNSLAEGNLVDDDTWRILISMVCQEEKLSKSFKVFDTLLMA